MAIVLESQQEKLVGVVEQSAWRTVEPAASDFMQIPSEKTAIAFKPNVREDEEHNGNRYRSSRDLSVDLDGVVPEIPLSGLVRQDFIDHQLFNFFQNVIVATQVKTFSFPTSAPRQPDFTTAGQGHYFTVCERNPSGNSYALKDGISRTLTFTIEQGDRLKYSSQIQGIGVPEQAYIPTGTWTKPADQFFFFKDMKATADLGAGHVEIRLKGFTITLEQTVMGVGHDSGEDESVYLGNYNLSLDLTVLRDPDQAALWKTLWLSTTSNDIPVRIYWGSTVGTSDGDLSFLMNMIINQDGLAPDNDDPLGDKISGRLVSEEGVAAPIQTIMNNAITRVGW